MSIQSFYATINGDLADVLGRLQTEERVEKFVRMFLMDETYQQLVDAMAADDLERAFRAAHTLKGTGRDLGFTALQQSASELADALRPGQDGTPAAPERAPELFAQVAQAYDGITAAAQEHL